MDEEKQIEEIRKVVSFNCNKEGIAKRCPERIANGIYEAGYRKQGDTVREFVQKLKEADERCQKKYGEGIGFTEIKEISEEYGVKID